MDAYYCARALAVVYEVMMYTGQQVHKENYEGKPSEFFVVNLCTALPIYLSIN
jgi:hypothetical protein